VTAETADGRRWIRIQAAITTDQPETATRAIEALTRAAVGLALDGAEVTVVAGPDWLTDDEAEDLFAEDEEGGGD
jgi:hypothetical protein